MAGYRLPLIAMAAAAGLLATGCGSAGSGSAGSTRSGGGTPSVASLLGSMKTAFKNANSVHITGSVAGGGQSYKLDLGITKANEMAGTITANGGSFYLLLTSGKVYVKVDSGFLKYAKIPSAACSAMCGKYLLINGALGSLTSGLSWSATVSRIMSAPIGSGALVTGKATVNGQQAWAIKANDGSAGYIAAHGPAYLLRVTVPVSQGSGNIDFTQWDSVTIPPPPPASQVIDISKLGG